MNKPTKFLWWVYSDLQQLYFFFIFILKIVFQ